MTAKAASRVVKGAFAVVHGLSQPSPEAELAANELETARPSGSGRCDRNRRSHACHRYRGAE